jgi:hypothetical protein
VIQALQRATPEQRAVLEHNYAKHDDACVAAVKQLYKDLNIEQVLCLSLHVCVLSRAGVPGLRAGELQQDYGND